jgi:hypothetical protein
MSALPPKADMFSARAHVCYGPIADMRRYSITSSARASSAGGMDIPKALAVFKLRASSSRAAVRLEGRLPVLP